MLRYMPLLCIAAIIFFALVGTAGSSSKPSIPDDLKLICYKGSFAVISPSAQEAMLFDEPCGMGKA